MTKTTFIALLLAITTGAASAGIIADAFAPHVAGIISATVALIVGFVFGAINSFVGRRARIASAKAAAERTLADRAAILADQQLRMLKIDQLTDFGVEFAKAHLDKLDPLRAPLAQADDLVTRYVEALERRNPDLALSLHLDRESATERLAGAIATVLAGMNQPATAASDGKV